MNLNTAADDSYGICIYSNGTWDVVFFNRQQDYVCEWTGKVRTLTETSFAKPQNWENFRCMQQVEFFLIHPAGTSMNSDKCDSIIVFSFIMVVYEQFFKNILKYLKEMKKYMYQQLKLNKNITK